MASSFRELKQRRIVQILVSYAVSGWVAMEVVGALVERSVLPEITYRVGLVIYLGGLVVAGIAGWYHGEKGHQRATRTEIVLLAVAVLVTLSLAFRTGRDFQAARTAERAATSGSLELSRVAVLYFRDLSRDGELGYLADGITEWLIERLEGVGSLDVVSREGVDPFRDGSLPRDSIASILSVGTLVEGSVEPRGEELRVTVTLFDGESGAEINRETLDRDAGDLFVLQEEVSEEVEDLLRVWLGTELQLRRVRRGTESLAAWTDLQRGQRARRDAEERLGAGDVPGFIADVQRADSLYAAAEAADPAWAEPTVGRALVASRWAELSAGEDPAEAREYMDRARLGISRALQKEPSNARALYVQGTVEYLTWLLGLADTPAEGERAFQRARESLEGAVAAEPTLASAWNTLSILYSQIPDLVEANLAARRALEADEFLRSGDGVLRRLYATSYDLEQFREAIRYCDQGHARFPDDPTFTECRLWLMAAPRALEPDPAEGWRLVDEHLALLPESQRPYYRIQDHLVMGQVLARAGLPDSARAMVSRARAGPELDPARELLGMEALVHLALDDPDTALARLRVYLTASPEHRSGWRWSSHWWWRPLQDHPDFRRLVGG